jgi:sigma-E factor negative regulatory protein RseA
MDDMMNGNERISALADGQLQGEAFARAVEAAAPTARRATWHAYHLVGDVLRSRELAGAPGAGVPGEAVGPPRAGEAVHLAGARWWASPCDRPRPVAQPAANDGAFRWKLVAGVASMAAVAAVGWSVLGHGRRFRRPAATGGCFPAGARRPATVLARSPTGAVMIRDPKLDELLAAHRQFGGASALQMPAGFLRNATFDGPAR